MTERERVDLLLRCSLIVETSKRIVAMAERSEQLGRQVAAHLEELRKPIDVPSFLEKSEPLSS